MGRQDRRPLGLSHGRGEYGVRGLLLGPHVRRQPVVVARVAGAVRLERERVAGQRLKDVLVAALHADHVPRARRVV